LVKITISLVFNLVHQACIKSDKLLRSIMHCLMLWWVGVGPTDWCSVSVDQHLAKIQFIRDKLIIH